MIHLRTGSMKREVCAPEKWSVEKMKITPIQAVTQTHGFTIDMLNCEFFKG